MKVVEENKSIINGEVTGSLWTSTICNNGEKHQIEIFKNEVLIYIYKQGHILISWALYPIHFPLKLCGNKKVLKKVITAVRTKSLCATVHLEVINLHYMPNTL